MKEMLVQIAANFVLVLGFGILLQTPKKSLLFLGLTGTISWTAFLIVSGLTGEAITATFFAALTVGLCGELFARLKKVPATIFIMAGILPLVPGVPAYQAMLHILEDDYLKGLERIVDTILIAAAIAFGIAIASGIFYYYRQRKENKSS